MTARSELDIQGARFYPIESESREGKPLWQPSTTSILRMCPAEWKSNWAASVEKTGILGDLEAWLHEKEEATRGEMLEQVLALRKRSLRHFGVMSKAADIGLSAHAWLEWEMKRRLGVEIGKAPILLPGADKVVAGALAWCEQVHLVPLEVEKRVHDIKRGYSGRYDVKAEIDWQEGLAQERRVVIVDWKSSKGIYDEMIVQNLAYRAADASDGNTVKSRGGVVIKLAKMADDPIPFEQRQVPFDAGAIDLFYKAIEFWRAWRKLRGEWTGGHASEADLARFKKRNGHDWPQAAPKVGWKEEAMKKAGL